MLLTMALAAMAACMLVFVHILANVAVEYDIKRNMERELYQFKKEVTVDAAGEVRCSDEFLRTDEFCFMVLDADGNVLLGEYPNGCPRDVCPQLKKLHEVTAGREVYYIRDIRRNFYKRKQVYLRVVVRHSDIYSRYQTMEYLSYVSILIVCSIAILGGILLSRRISSSLKSMCQSAEAIGRDQNLSERMAYNGRYYELAVLAQANNRMLDRFEEIFRQQEQFTSDVAHELRTPVAVMTAQCQYVQGRPVQIEDYREAFEIIERQSVKITEIIARLLELSRLDYDRRQIQAEDVDLPEIVQSICEDLQQKAGDTLQFRMHLAQAQTIGDISLVAIATQNLVTNAVKYSAQGSLIEIETGQKEQMAFVEVKDHGIGISQEDMAYIFKRFYKADKSRNSQGFGLGLPLTMKIAEKHGGNVLAESVPGQGSTFTLLLPGA